MRAIVGLVAVAVLAGEAFGFVRQAVPRARPPYLRSSLSGRTDSVPAPVVLKKSSNANVRGTTQESLDKAVSQSKFHMASVFALTSLTATKLFRLAVKILLQWAAAFKRNSQNVLFKSIGVGSSKPIPPAAPSRAPSPPMDVAEARKYASKVIEEIAVLEAQTAARNNLAAGGAVSLFARESVSVRTIADSSIASSFIASSSSTSLASTTKSSSSSASNSSVSSSASSSASPSPNEPGPPGEEEQGAEDQNKITMAKIKSMGTSGVIAYAITELGFWLTSVPLALVVLHAQSGEWLSITDEADRVKVLTFAATFITGARLLVPARLALALALTPFVDNLRGKGEESKW